MNEVVAVDNVRQRYGEVEALRGVSFALEGPQVIGILGPNGAGKTTLLDVLEGLAAPSEGNVRLFGERVRPDSYPRKRVGVVMQREFILDGITVSEYAELFAAIYKVRGGKQQILVDARLVERARAPLAKISGGEAQRLFIAAAVVHRPELVFLDEPTAHLDPAGKRDVGAQIRAMGKDRTVIVTTHDLREADAVCDHVLFLVDGQVRAAGARAALVEAVPQEARRAGGIEDAFFHFCAVRLNRSGELES